MNSADKGNIRAMYDGIKEATGPTQKKTAPLKSVTGEVLNDQSEQMERWVEHYSKLYSRQNTVRDDALDAVERLPILDELDIKPMMEEFIKGFDALAAGKAPGKDGIPPDIIKCAKDTLLEPLHKLLCTCWREGTAASGDEGCQHRHSV